MPAKRPRSPPSSSHTILDAPARAPPPLPGSGHVMANHPPRILKVLAKIERHRSLEAGMELAVAAADILLGAIELPVGRRVQFAESLVVAVGDQVAGTFPALRIAGHGGPRTAQQDEDADQEEEIDWRVDE